MGRSSGVVILAATLVAWLAGCGGGSSAPPATQPPVAVLVADLLHGEPPLRVVFDGSLSNHPDGTIVRYEFDFDEGEGYEDHDDNPLVAHTYHNPGLYRIWLRVTSSDGASNSTSVVIVANSPPEAVLTASPSFGQAPVETVLDASSSRDPDGSLVELEWDWDGDGVVDQAGAFEDECVAEYTYQEPGLYSARVTVIDDLGHSDTAAVSIEVLEFLGPGDWPMLGRDPRHSWRSPVEGPRSATLKWKFVTGRAIRSSAVFSVAATVYFSSLDGHLYALNPDGSERWEFQLATESYSSPAVGSDGAIYIAAGQNLHAVNPDGSEKWTLTDLGPGSFWGSCTLDQSDTIYLGDYGTGTEHVVRAISPDGDVAWTYLMGGYMVGSCALAADGTVYIGGSDVNGSRIAKLVALWPDGSERWTYMADGGTTVNATPAISADGTIYFGSSGGGGSEAVAAVYALRPDGTEKWSALTDDEADYGAGPSVASDGTVYVAGGFDDSIHALSPDGDELWTYQTQDSNWTSIAIDKSGMLYFGSGDRFVYCLSPDGKLQWRYRTDGAIYADPSIGEDGTLYIGSDDGCMYAFGDE